MGSIAAPAGAGCRLPARAASYHPPPPRASIRSSKKEKEKTNDKSARDCEKIESYLRVCVG